MNQSASNPEPSQAVSSSAPVSGARDEASYRAGLERAMTLIWAEKQKLSVITPAYFALAKVWDELYREANPNGGSAKH